MIATALTSAALALSVSAGLPAALSAQCTVGENAASLNEDGCVLVNRIGTACIYDCNGVHELRYCDDLLP